MRSKKAIFGTLAFFGALALVPLVVGNMYTIHIFILTLTYLVVVAAWDLIMGYGGAFSFAQVGFFVIGAYASGMISIRTGMSPWLTMPIAGLVTAIVGVLICLPCLRVRGSYVALITYALVLVLPTFILRGGPLGTGGAQGLVGVPGLSIGGFVFSPMDLVPWFYTALGLAALCIGLIYFVILPSTYGLSLMALRDSEVLARHLGVSQYFTKTTLFAASAFFTGLAGAFYVHYTGAASQRLLGMDFFLLLLVMLTLGGMGRYPGVLIGTFAFAFVNEYFRISGTWRLVFIGSIIVIGTLVLPQGLVSLGDWPKSIYKKWRQRQEADRAAVDSTQDH